MAIYGEMLRAYDVAAHMEKHFQIAKISIAAATEARRLAAIRAGGYPSQDVKRIANRKVWVGMSKEQALLSWGAPPRRHERITASGKTEVWSYGPSALTLDNGRVVTIDQSK
jgi:hypothetical protein